MNDQNDKECEEKILHIGFDDTDSTKGQCTTHLAFKLADILIKKFKISFIDFPLLIRLNPNIPLKTRGNGAVCLRIKGKKYEKIKEEVIQYIENYSDLENGANPGIAFYENNEIPQNLISFNMYAMDSVLSKQIAEKIASKNKIQYHLIRKGYGLVGALASIGCILNKDHTYETIAYRKSENLGTERKIDKYRVKKLNDELSPYTFNNFDFKKNRILISPHGPDPVFCGIRGEDPITTALFLKYLQIKEELEGYITFRSNQGTNHHLTNKQRLSNILPFTAGITKCQVITKPTTIRGGHIIFYVKDYFNDIMPVAVYAPTQLTKIAALLEIEDKIELGYGVNIKSNNLKTLNLEYLVIKDLKKIVYYENPICKKCMKKTKSEGKNKGFECPICKSKFESKIQFIKDRKVKCGLYIPNPSAHRHLTKPLSRYNIEKTFDLSNITLFLNNAQWFLFTSS